ncbi:MAG: thermonuclease family protein [Nanoarchaeota archaeon]
MKTFNVLIFLLIFNTFILLGYLTSESTGKVTYERVISNLTRVIDGDTVVIADGTHIRMLGINTPEKKQPYYQEALDFLKKYTGKKVEIEERGTDKYDRTLGYVYFDNKMINSEILNQGLANLYVYDKDEHYSELQKAEKYARDNNLGLWKKSRNFGCVEIKEFEPVDKTQEDEETLILENKCNINLEMIIKDDANHIYNEEINKNSILEKHFKDIFNDGGDSLYIRDDSGLLLFYRY